MNNSTTRLLKGLAGVVAVVVILFVVFEWWGDYKQAASRLSGGTATSTVDATKTPPASGSPSAARTATVLIEGLNFRKKPVTGGATIRGLKKGEKLTLMATRPDWYQVKDSKGTVGWIAAKPQYVRLDK